MLRQLILSAASKSLPRTLPVLAAMRPTRGMAGKDLKKEFDELKHRLEEQKSDQQDKDGKAKSMDELLKESREEAKKMEEERKQQFQEMKQQKTSLEFGDIIKELKAKPKQYIENVRHAMKTIGSKVAPVVAKIKGWRGKKEEAEPASAEKADEKVTEQKEEIRVEVKTEEELAAEEKARPPGIFRRTQTRMSLKFNAIDGRIQAKFPQLYARAGKVRKSFVELWHQTFPSQEDIVKARMERVRQEAKEQLELEEKMKTMTEEEIKKIQETIPEHRRKALVLRMEAAKEKEKGGVWSKLSETETVKGIKESKEFKQYAEMAKGVKEFAQILKEEVNESSSPTVAGARSFVVFFARDSPA